MLDDFLDQMLLRLEQSCAGGDPTALEVRRARVIIQRVRYCQKRDLLENAPRLRRHILADIRAATRSLERKWT